jgi:hypothetical protein
MLWTKHAIAFGVHEVVAIENTPMTKDKRVPTLGHYLCAVEAYAIGFRAPGPGAEIPFDFRCWHFRHLIFLPVLIIPLGDFEGLVAAPAANTIDQAVNDIDPARPPSRRPTSSTSWRSRVRVFRRRSYDHLLTCLAGLGQQLLALMRNLAHSYPALATWAP